MTKRFVAILLVVLLCVGLLPSSVFAGQGGVKAGGNNIFPLNELKKFTVTWTDEKGEKVYTQEKGTGDDQSTIDALPKGTYSVEIAIADGGDLALEMGKSYTYQLDWPKEEVLSQAENHSGDITYTDEKNTIYDIGTYSVDTKGLLTISINDNDDMRHLDDWWGSLTFSVRIAASGDGYDVPWEDKDCELVKSTDGYDAAHQSITWKIETTIPAYGGSGEASQWSVRDLLSLGTDMYGHIENKMEDIVVTATSENGYNGQVPFVEEATEEHPFAYCLVHGEEDKRSDEEQILLVNRCTCAADHCPGGDACSRLYQSAKGEVYVDAKGEKWCSCWQYRYNERLSITYHVDPTEVLQQLADRKVSDGIKVTNFAHLFENDNLKKDGSAEVILQIPLMKSQLEPPTQENEYVVTWQIVVNPGRESFSGADYLTVTDTMEHMVYLKKEPNMTIETEEGSLIMLTEEEWQTLPEEEQTEDTYFCLELTDDGMTIKIFKPTDQTYTITYDAALNQEEPSDRIDYRNTASVGHIEVSVADEHRFTGSEWMGATRILDAAKVDAYHHEVSLPGAVFKVYQYVPDEEGLYLTEKVTDENGVLSFCTDRKAGIVVFPDTLYYLQEAEAPEGYLLDETKYYFYYRSYGSDGISKEDLPEGVSEEAGNLFISQASEDGRGLLFCTLENIPMEEEGEVPEEPEKEGEEPEIEEVPEEENPAPVYEEEPEEEELYSPPVKTGDHAPLVGLILFCTAGLAGIFGCVYIRSKK